MEEALIKRILPHSIEAEQSVIGSMILDRDAILVASEILTSDDFYQKQSFPALQPGTLPGSSSYDLLYIICDAGLSDRRR